LTKGLILYFIFNIIEKLIKKNMGFFDKVKSAVNKVTGGGAKVTITCEGDKLNEPVKVHITAVIKDAPLECSKVYVRVKSVERVTIPKKEINPNPQFDIHLEKEIFNVMEFEAAPAQTLEGGQTYNWTYEVNIPQGPNVKPTYIGNYVSHEWVFYAALDIKGNDPDSGWVAHTLV